MSMASTTKRADLIKPEIWCNHLELSKKLSQLLVCLEEVLLVEDYFPHFVRSILMVKLCSRSGDRNTYLLDCSL